MGEDVAVSTRSSPEQPIVFFDIGATLGRARLSPPPTRLLGIHAYPHVPGVLDELRSRGIELGIVSDTGSETAAAMEAHLRAAGLLRYFREDLLIFSSVVGKRKDSPEIFELAAARAAGGGPARDCIYVGEDNVERQHAVDAGWRAVPHPSLAAAVVDGKQLRFVRITIPTAALASDWRGLLRSLELVPLRVVVEELTTVDAVVSESAMARLADVRLPVQALGGPGDPITNDLYVLREDEASATGLSTGAGQARDTFAGDDATLLMAASPEGVTVRIGADRSVEEFHFATAEHGHTVKLMPDLGLLDTSTTPAVPPPAGPEEATAGLAVERDVTDDERRIIAGLTPSLLGGHLDRYTGGAPLGDAAGTAVASRHILHVDNRRSTDQLAADLQRIGGGMLSVGVHGFVHGGRSYRNVVAELPGSDDDAVLVTAHLDSTAAFSSPYDATVDPAPGTDDDASGTAAVLSAAEIVMQLVAIRRPQRSIRFVLFNAEEHGLIGSQAYARDVRAAGEAVAGVFQMDMIGYNVAAPASWEVHAGYLASPVVQDRSLALAGRVRRMATVVSPMLGDMQVYRSTSSADRDPAEGRSDHAAFHQRGYAAIVATEDFFAGPGVTAPAAEPNPHYHRGTDTFIDRTYAAGIARAVVAAAWVTATPTVAQQGGDSMGIKMASGNTVPGATAWKAYGGSGIYLDVDTSACGFTDTPHYITSIGGISSHWATTGATSIYSATRTGFRVYVRWAGGGSLSPVQANRWKWHINWFGMQG